MTAPGSYKIASRSRAYEALLEPGVRRARRVRRILDSLRNEIVDGGGDLRIRRIFSRPREIFRLELELPEIGYQRTTLLDRDALEELLAADEVQAALAQRPFPL